jgi:peptidoglycan/xylan/chitin deacetylase (PgdA/CDA1 family)
MPRNAMTADSPLIAMTFDDGPDGTRTPRLLDLAAQRPIRLTFFLLGIKVAREPDIARRIAAEVHEIGNHSWSHPNFTELSGELLGRRPGALVKA